MNKSGHRTVVLFIALQSTLGVSCTGNPAKESADSFLPAAPQEKWLLSNKIKMFLERQETFRDFEKTGLSRTEYLKIIDGQVRVFQQCQSDSGRIIDPYMKQEAYFATPCYAHSVAALAASGYTKDVAVIESGMRAMDIVTDDMSRNYSANGHGDFFTWPVMHAFTLFKGIADEQRYERWRNNIAGMQPEKFYRAYGDYRSNWNVVNAAGEFLRCKENFTSLQYVETCLKSQLFHFTAEGMYNEHDNPLPYDAFPRHYLSGMLAFGYQGAYADLYRDITWKGAWVSLFLQSPFGELPTGYRSSHHIWNEAELCVIFEIFATQYARTGDRGVAGAFKRAAMLSLGSIQSWIQPDGAGYIVKNKYPAKARHGYEGYSGFSSYNLLACSMLAQAWQHADDRVEETPAPADVGGYVVSLLDPFHKIVASAGSSYIEYDTRGDQMYNPTGLLRIHLKGGHPQLGPSDGCAQKFSGAGISLATGPSWQHNDGAWVSLAELQPGDPVIEIIRESPQLVQFRVSYDLSDELDADITVAETFTIVEGQVTVEDEVTGSGTGVGMRVTWPMLVFNGEKNSIVHIENNTAVLDLEGKKIKFTLIDPGKTSVVRSGNQYAHRNGMVEPLIAEIKGKKIIYRIETMNP